MEDHQDEDMVFMGNIVQQVQSKVVDFKPDLNFEGLTLQLLVHKADG